MSARLLRWALAATMTTSLMNGCGEDGPPASEVTTPGSAESAPATETPPEEPAEPEAAPITLEATEVPDMGVSIQIPAGARTLAASAQSTTYSLALPGGLHEINVQIRGFGEPDLERARATASSMGDTVRAAETLESGAHLVELESHGPLQSFESYLAERSARCTAPADRADLCREIVASLASAGD